MNKYITILLLLISYTAFAQKQISVSLGNGGSGSAAFLKDSILSRKSFLSDVYFKGPVLQENNIVDIPVKSLIATNTATYLTTPTYDGSGEAMHPDVYYNPNKWNGYKWWMAMTPYKNTNDKYENPSLLCSNDGITWVTPPGVTNPISPEPTDTVNVFQADPDIIPPGAFDNKMRIIYRRTLNKGTHATNIYSRSYDGVTVSSEITIISNAFDSIISPCVVELNNVYTMYYIDIVSTPNLLKKRTATNPDGPWSESTTCTINNTTGYDLWHVNANIMGNQTHLWVTTTNMNTYGSFTRLFFAKSDNGIDFTMGSTPVIDINSSGWDNQLIYRVAAIALDGITKGYGIFYSAMSSGSVWHTGYTETTANIYATQFKTDTNVSWRSGNGSPEGLVIAGVGSYYTRKDGGANTTLYIKESGTGNTGWIAK